MKIASLFAISVFLLIHTVGLAAAEAFIEPTEEDRQIIVDLELFENLAMLEDMLIVENYELLENGSPETWLETDEEAK